jgi:dsRNA-specific ribonuclease
VELPDGRLCVSIEFGGDQIFKGVGKNSKAAKTAAAKYALSRLNQKV